MASSFLTDSALAPVGIADIQGWEILDSRGMPTVRAEVVLSDGSRGVADAPNGASTGTHEAHVLRDGDGSRYQGQGVQKAVQHVNGALRKALLGCPPVQAEVDKVLLACDGSAQKTNMGGNALLAISIAHAKASAKMNGWPLWQYVQKLHQFIYAQKANPTAASPQAITLARAVEHAPALPLPMINLFSGGKHAGQQLDFQDFLIVPHGADSFSQAMVYTQAVYHAARALVTERYGDRGLVADEGGLAPAVSDHTTLLTLSMEAIERAGLRPGIDVALALDVAASHFGEYNQGATTYHLKAEQRQLSAQEMIALFQEWRTHYPIVSIEDGLAEEDWQGWAALNQAMGKDCQIIGDDLLVTNVNRINKAIQGNACNSLLVKINQIGTLTEALQALATAQQAGWSAVISARSGDTEDDWLADVAVGTGAGQIKIGSITRSERLAKYNRLLTLAHQHPEWGFSNMHFAHCLST